MTRTSRYHTQWAAQFYVAAELTRRGYFVILTLGKRPSTIDKRPRAEAHNLRMKSLRASRAGAVEVPVTVYGCASRR